MADTFFIPKGFRAAGIFCGIKKAKKDLSLIVSDAPATAAGVYTQNKVCAAPVVLSKERVMSGQGIRAIITNSGNANACTGDSGITNARLMAQAIAKELNCDESSVLVSSTGVIGQTLPVQKIEAAARTIVKECTADNFASAAEAIMTTDTFPKIASEQFTIGAETITILGMAKGSGMIAPNMATMLGYVCTDARIGHSTLQKMLSYVNERSFNSITVDGDTSTNDMVLLLANGAASANEIAENSNEYNMFLSHLEAVSRSLAQMIVRDGEGATKFIEINVRGAASEDAARTAARSIANSNLVKTAIHGEDANWGRIAAAVGYSGIDFTPEEMEIWIGDVQVLKKNYGIDFDEAHAKEVLSKKDIIITVNLNGGNGAASFWTCDLSKEYIHINASYRS
jgi:glutamate N-acetyltransferase/amino-acid N-acetyltransferase